MDDSRFREAQEAYEAGDFRKAAKLFLASAGSGEENGVAYHMAGNSLMRLRRYSDAVTVYGHALKDESYDRHSAVLANLGAAQAAVGSYAEAVAAYDAALADPAYVTRYRALRGKAGALYEMGRYAEAAAAYGDAALDADNPDPGSALNNLGLTHMALGRPGDAAEAYREAIRIDTYEGRGKASANLGLAYAALGRHDDAVKAFEKSTQLFGHELSPEAAAVYEASRTEIGAPPLPAAKSGAAARDREIVEGWRTGEQPPVSSDEAGEDAPGAPPKAPGDTAGVPDDLDSDFFTLTDAEMRERDKAARKAEKAERRSGGAVWKRVAVWAGAALALVVAVIVLWAMGYGYPTQAQTVRGLIDSRTEGEDVGRYWVAVPSADVDKEMAKLPVRIKGYEISGVERSPRTSRVSLTVTLEQGAPLRYGVTMAREGVGWKVTGVENEWRSTNGNP